MASLINITASIQAAHKDFMHLSPEKHWTDAKFSIIAKGNIIEGIEAKE